MILVALLTGDSMDDAGVGRLATTLGVVPYEARMTLNGGYPAIVATHADTARAYEQVASLRAGGADAVACDGREVVSSEAMLPIDHFTLDPRALHCASGELPWSDVLCLLRATHRARNATETTASERKFSAGRSLLSGGLSNTTMVKVQSREVAESRQQVLYVFRHSGEPPWILREQGTHYEGLGPLLSRTAIENFGTMCRALRERAPHATHDERLLSRSRVAERDVRHGTAAQATISRSSASGIDTLAHLIALSLARERSQNPYRR